MLKLQPYSDFMILKLIKKYHYITLRQISYYSGISLGTAHTKINNLSKKKLLIIKDISNGSRKKRFQYILTEEGAQHLELLRSKLIILLADLNDSTSNNLNFP